MSVSTYAFLLSYNNWTNDSIKQQSDAVMTQTISQFKRDLSYTFINTENISNEFPYKCLKKILLLTIINYCQERVQFIVIS